MISLSDGRYKAQGERGNRGVGASLRAAREAGGETIYDAAKALRIRAEYLYALEENDFQSLPGWAYALSFVRTYAEYLGLEPTPIVKRVREQYELRQHMLYAEAAREASRPRWRRMGMVAAGLAVAGVLAAGLTVSHPTERISGLLESVPLQVKAWIDRSFFTIADTSQASTPPASGGKPDSQHDPAVGADRPVVPAASLPGAGNPSPRFGALRDDVGSTASAAELPVDRPAGSSPPVSGSVVLRARGPVWLTVEDGRGHVLLAQQLRRGELYRLPADPSVALSADNAGAIEYYVDGRLAGTLGPPRHEISRLPLGRLTGDRPDG